ncbi:MAG: hypothetical protein H0W50_03030 [Parachlamydiaceae bacterium]|nr:hypothetical protein [Parachlamydiaceae bacterium]
MNVFSSIQSASWQQYTSLLNKESAGKCLQNIATSLASPVTPSKGCTSGLFALFFSFSS